MIIVDTCALFAYFKAADPNHEAAASVFASTDEPFVVSPYVVAELDHLVLTRMGQQAELAVLSELTEGTYEFPIMAAADLLRCMSILRNYPDHRLGIADVSLVVLAERYRTDRILTFDRRDFSILCTMDGKPFTLLP